MIKENLNPQSPNSYCNRSIEPHSEFKGMSDEELMLLLQDGKITYLCYVTTGSYKHVFIDWLLDNHLEPSDFTAKAFMNEVEEDFLQSQIMPQDFSF